MQSLLTTTKDPCVRECSREVMDGATPVVWAIRRHMRQYRRGLSVPQFRALVLVDSQPSLSLSAVADFLGASLSNTSRIIAGLVEKGFIARNGSSDDRRQLELTLTDHGREVLNSAWSATRDHLAAEIAPLSGRERAVVVEAMKILKGVFGAVGLPDEQDAALAATQ